VTQMHQVLLINPTITKARHARFPLAVMSLANAMSDRYGSTMIDGNIDRDFIGTACAAIREKDFDAVGITVMGGPQIPTAAAVSKAIRAMSPQTPIIWGGYFPTICPIPSVTAPFVDYVIRGQGEVAMLELMQAIVAKDEARLEEINGLTWRRGREIVHNKDRPFSPAALATSLPYERLENPARYLGRTYLGQRTAGYQAALGCRFRCTFCGVATMFGGKTALPTAERLRLDLTVLKHRLGADSIQFYDHNFFDREVEMIPLLEVLAELELPWWCFARSDALLNLSDASWKLVRKSGLRMAYIGAESPDDELLREVRKGTRADQTLSVVEKCRSNGVIPELSFMLAPPHDPEGATERTFDFIREIKRIHPRTEIMIYIYTPIPVSSHRTNSRASRSVAPLLDAAGKAVVFPRSVDEWSTPEWVNYWCHTDAPWLTRRLRRRISDFTTVLGCRFPTITDIRSPPIGKATLRALASWRYRFQKYNRPWELDLSQRIIRLHNPRASSL
jgi:anaerobic magnesium-protoporphyrin IX monomethyl ester cyclase